MSISSANESTVDSVPLSLERGERSMTSIDYGHPMVQSDIVLAYDFSCPFSVSDGNRTPFQFLLLLQWLARGFK
ncbi:hypothetical protein K435DRAFT_861665 [Dendrothele bispora CBS 962.96]|uniref:Uncharacterized protein n=1 Tax=Dendrothele bispora (strain CBS 962.96) TaxID=1314807 RepID=A0A4S8KS63_DENBC|nr:hypothetical protein K435DRAFT_876397 [Dendrothele bispora CBS 962.96]THU93274.1 hypothetical protein K435DRAFT_861665 [Dendrothele bispora CBS 962.96]